MDSAQTTTIWRHVYAMTFADGNWGMSERERAPPLLCRPVRAAIENASQPAMCYTLSNGYQMAVRPCDTSSVFRPANPYLASLLIGHAHPGAHVFTGLIATIHNPLMVILPPHTHPRYQPACELRALRYHEFWSVFHGTSKMLGGANGYRKNHGI